MDAKVLAVIPARWASTRFPGKPLVKIGGMSMIERVCRQLAQAKLVTHVVVATDHEEIFSHVRAFGAEAIMTNPNHPSGTDRCAEVARLFSDAELVINVQGDEPFIQPQQIDLLIDFLLAHPDISIATLSRKIEDSEQLFNPNVVKVVFSEQSKALYFSRHPIPYIRGAEKEEWLAKGAFYKHIGMYGFRRETLLNLATLEASPLEKAESLEQLRWLQHGYEIGVALTTLETIGIDTPEDLLRIESFNA